MSRRAGDVAGVLLMVAFSAACTDPFGDRTGGPARTYLVIEGPNDLEPGTTATFRAILHVSPDPDHRAGDVSQDALWNTTAAGVLSIDRGMATALEKGVATLEVRLTSGQSASKLVTVGGTPTSAPPAILVGQTVEGMLTPAAAENVYELTAPADGLLVVRLTWDASGREVLSLVIGETEFPAQPPGYSPLVARLPIRAGMRYLLRISTSPWDTFGMRSVLATGME